MCGEDVYKSTASGDESGVIFGVRLRNGLSELTADFLEVDVLPQRVLASGKSFPKLFLRDFGDASLGDGGEPVGVRTLNSALAPPQPAAANAALRLRRKCICLGTLVKAMAKRPVPLELSGRSIFKGAEGYTRSKDGKLEAPDILLEVALSSTSSVMKQRRGLGCTGFPKSDPGPLRRGVAILTPIRRSASEKDLERICCPSVPTSVMTGLAIS